MLAVIGKKNINQLRLFKTKMNQDHVQGGLNPFYPSSSPEKNHCGGLQLHDKINKIEEQRLMSEDAWRYKIHEFIEEINGMSKTLVDDLSEILKWNQIGAQEVENEARIEMDRLQEATRKLNHIDCVLKAFSNNANNILCTKSGNNNSKLNNRFYVPQQNNYTVVFDLSNSPDEEENSNNENKKIDGGGKTGDSNKDQSFFSQTTESKSHSFINQIENM